MKLVMFDMDGTLTDSFCIQERCYERAIEDVLGLRKVRIDWHSFPHTSASYCLNEVVRTARGHPPNREESRAVQQRLIALMDEIAREKGSCTREIPGAAATMRELQRRGYGVAIASGDWEATARKKFADAAIPFEGLPSAYCEAGHARTAIMRTALERASSHYQCTSFERITYVGDAPWDVRACRELSWPLVAIAREERAANLQSLGATHVLPHYMEFDAFLTAVETAASPS